MSRNLNFSKIELFTKNKKSDFCTEIENSRIFRKSWKIGFQGWGSESGGHAERKMPKSRRMRGVSDDDVDERNHATSQQAATHQREEVVAAGRIKWLWREAIIAARWVSPLAISGPTAVPSGSG